MPKRLIHKAQRPSAIFAQYSNDFRSQRGICLEKSGRFQLFGNYDEHNYIIKIAL